MAHIKKYWAFYLGILLLILVAYELKWFGNTTTLFKAGGAVNSGGGHAAPGAGEGSHPVQGNSILPRPIVVNINNTMTCQSIRSRMDEIKKLVKEGDNIDNYRKEAAELHAKYNSLNCMNSNPAIKAAHNHNGNQVGTYIWCDKGDHGCCWEFGTWLDFYVNGSHGQYIGCYG